MDWSFCNKYEKVSSFFSVRTLGSAAFRRLAGISVQLSHFRGLCSSFMAGTAIYPGRWLFRMDLSYPPDLEWRDNLVGLKFHRSRRHLRHPGQFPAHDPSLGRFSQAEKKTGAGHRIFRPDPFLARL